MARPRRPEARCGVTSPHRQGVRPLEPLQPGCILHTRQVHAHARPRRDAHRVQLPLRRPRVPQPALAARAVDRLRRRVRRDGQRRAEAGARQLCEARYTPNGGSHPGDQQIGASSPATHARSRGVACVGAASCCKYAVPEGYPDKPLKNSPIDLSGLTSPDLAYYGAVDKTESGQLLATGSRAVAVVCTAEALLEAEAKTEAEVSSIKGKVFHRTDIGAAAGGNWPASDAARAPRPMSPPGGAPRAQLAPTDPGAAQKRAVASGARVWRPPKRRGLPPFCRQARRRSSRRASRTCSRCAPPRTRPPTRRPSTSRSSARRAARRCSRCCARCRAARSGASSLRSCSRTRRTRPSSRAPPRTACPPRTCRWRAARARRTTPSSRRASRRRGCSSCCW